MTRGAGPGPAENADFYRIAARIEFEPSVELASRTSFDCEIICWLVDLDRDTLDALAARLKAVPPGLEYIEVIINSAPDDTVDAVLTIEVCFEDDPGPRA